MGVQRSESKLVVIHFDDNPYELEAVETALRTESFGPRFVLHSCISSDEVRERLDVESSFDVALLDIHEQKSESKVGIDLVEVIKRKYPHSVIIMRSSHSDPASIVTCLRAGADDFISKSTDKGELSLRIFNAWQLARIKNGSNPVADHGKPLQPLDGVGETTKQLYARIPRIMESAITAVHIYGEPGTGKEVVAEAFERLSPKGKPFVKVNCGAISPALLESELFGHVKGAYTGATAERRGLIEEADGGWLYLDEIATLPSSAQVALLRVIENQEIRPVGTSKTKKVSVRVISAANERLEELVRRGVFRKDLWQRLVETQIELPPLRDRRDEIRPLIQAICQSMAGGPYVPTEAVMSVLSQLDWRDGNIRELRNCLRAMTELSTDKTLTPLSIPARYWGVTRDFDKLDNPMSLPLGRNEVDAQELVIQWNPSEEGNFECAVDELLKQLIGILYVRHKRLSVRMVSKLTGIAKTTLAEKLRRLVERKIMTADDMERMVGLEATRVKNSPK